MSLKPSPIQPVPAETARVARAAFPKGNVYLKLRDQLAPSSATRILRRSFRRMGSRPMLRGD